GSVDGVAEADAVADALSLADGLMLPFWPACPAGPGSSSPSGSDGPAGPSSVEVTQMASQPPATCTATYPAKTPATAAIATREVTSAALRRGGCSEWPS